MDPAADRVEILSDPGTPPNNEDAAGRARAGNALLLWVVDGATSVAERQLLGQPMGDVAWYARAVSAALAQRADAAAPLGEIVAAAICDVAAEYRRLLADRTPEPHETPIAAMVLARITPIGGARMRVEGARLGDCCLFVAGNDTVHALAGLHDTAEEAKMHAKVGEQRRAGLTDEAAVRAAYLPELRRQRARLTGPGMPVLGLDPTVGDRLKLETADISGSDTAVLAMSDGFYRGVEIYGEWTAGTLFADCWSRGLAWVLERLRDIENAPGSLDRHPRLKRRDDASAALWKA